MRFAASLRDRGGGDGEEAVWVMLFMKCAENQCVPDSGKCKKVYKTITYHSVKRAAEF